MLFTREFWVGAAERALKSSAQAGILALGADFSNVLSLDWATLGGAMTGGALLSVLTAVAFPAQVPVYQDIDA